MILGWQVRPKKTAKSVTIAHLWFQAAVCRGLPWNNCRGPSQEVHQEPFPLSSAFCLSPPFSENVTERSIWDHFDLNLILAPELLFRDCGKSPRWLFSNCDPWCQWEHIWTVSLCVTLVCCWASSFLINLCALVPPAWTLRPLPSLASSKFFYKDFCTLESICQFLKLLCILEFGNFYSETRK